VNVRELLVSTASLLPDRVALVLGDNRMTYRQLHLLSNKIANSLLAAGLRRGEHVAILMSYCPEWLAVYFGMHLPVTFWSYPNFLARIPILFKGGVEFTVAHKVNLWVTPIDLGPSIYASRLYSGAWLSASFMLGAAFPF